MRSGACGRWSAVLSPSRCRLAAFRLLGLSDADEVETALERTLDGPAPDVIALAWIALASGPGLSELAVPP